jgi:hypothetical protein
MPRYIITQPVSVKNSNDANMVITDESIELIIIMKNIVMQRPPKKKREPKNK